MDRILKAFEKLIPPEENAVKARVDKEGGVDAFLDDDDRLQDLLKERNATKRDGDSQNQATLKPDGPQRTSKKSYEVKELKMDLAEDIDTVLQKNMETFERKL